MLCISSGIVLKCNISILEWNRWINVCDWIPQCDMLRDPKLLNMFRELLVVFRIWGLIRVSCLPSFCHMENIDVIATLFRILTRLVQSSDLDDNLIGQSLYSYNLFQYHKNLNVWKEKKRIPKNLLNLQRVP